MSSTVQEGYRSRKLWLHRETSSIPWRLGQWYPCQVRKFTFSDSPSLSVPWLPVGHTSWAEDHLAVGLSMNPMLIGIKGHTVRVMDPVKWAGERSTKESALLGCTAHPHLRLDLDADPALHLAISEVRVASWGPCSGTSSWAPCMEGPSLS